MLEINKRTVNGREVTTFSDEMTHANILEIEVGTNGLQGGDTGHGGRTYFRLTDLGCTDIETHVTDLAYGGKTLEIELGGDAELITFIKALEFAVKILTYQAGFKKEEDE